MTRRLWIISVLFELMLVFTCTPLGGPRIASAEWPSDPMVNVLIATGENVRYWPQIVSDGAGGAIMVWHDRRSGLYDIYAQRVDVHGNVLWPPNGVPISLAPDEQVIPELTSDGAGGAIIAWRDYRDVPSNGNLAIYAQRVDAHGNVLWTHDGVRISRAAQYLDGPSTTKLINDGAGGAIIVWDRTCVAGFGGVCAQRIDANGNVLWGADGILLVPPSLSGTHIRQPQLTSDDAGGAIIVWDGGCGAEFGSVCAQRVDGRGNVLWNPGGIAVSAKVGGPQITTDGAAGAIIVWLDTAFSAVYAQRIDANGNVLWPPNGVPMVVAAGIRLHPEVTSDGAGGAIIVWEDGNRITFGPNDLYAQRVDANGNVLWNHNGVPLVTSASDEQYTKLVSDGAGGAIVVWMDGRNRTTNDSFDLYAQRISSGGNVLWAADGVPISTAQGAQSFPQLTSNSVGGAIIVWVDDRRGLYSAVGAGDAIYAQNVNADGTLGPRVPKPITLAELSMMLLGQEFCVTTDYLEPLDDVPPKFKPADGRHAGIDYGSLRQVCGNKHSPLLEDIFGRPVIHPANGTVIRTEVDKKGRPKGFGGVYIYLPDAREPLDADKGFTVIYLHLDSIQVQPDDQLVTGTLVGTVGRTGVPPGSGLHLHVEVRHGRQCFATGPTSTFGGSQDTAVITADPLFFFADPPADVPSTGFRC